MVMSAKTDIVQIKISRNQGGGLHFRHMLSKKFALDWKKKRSFWRSMIFDHLPPCGFGDYIINVWS